MTSKTAPRHSVSVCSLLPLIKNRRSVLIRRTRVSMLPLETFLRTSASIRNPSSERQERYRDVSDETRIYIVICREMKGSLPRSSIIFFSLTLAALLAMKISIERTEGDGKSKKRLCRSSYNEEQKGGEKNRKRPDNS